MEATVDFQQGEGINMFLLRQTIERQVSDIRQLVGLEEIDVEDHQAMGLSALHYAAWYNNITAVQTLIGWEHDVMARDAEGATPLHYVARFKNRCFQDASGLEKKPTSPKAVIQALINAGAELNARDSMGTTALVNAILRGNRDAVEELVQLPGIDVESSDNRGITSLHVAAKYNRIESTRLLLSHGSPVLAADDMGETPMHIAAEEDNVEIMELLLGAMKGNEKEVVDALTKAKEAPIDLAIENRNHAAVKLCLEHGANIRKTAREGHHSPLHFAAAAGGPSIVIMLLDKDPLLMRMPSADRSTALHRAAQFDRVKVAKILIERKADIEARDSMKNTPLHVAVRSGSHRVLDLLVQNGAQMDVINKKDRTILHIAADANKPDTLKIILDHIRNAGFLDRVISSDDRMGNSPLHLASAGGFLEVTKILLENGADIRNKNENEEAALHVAASTGRTAVVRELLRATDEMNEDVSLSIIHDEDENGNTPLHLAAENGHAHAAQLLLDFNATQDPLNRRLWTPVFCAAAEGHLETLQALLKDDVHPDDLNLSDRGMNTPMHLAAHAGHEKVVKALIDHGASVSVLNAHGQNALDIAIQLGHKEVALVIVESEKWRDALRNRCTLPSLEKDTTPFRQLVRKMPDVAEVVMDNCVEYPEGSDVTDPELSLNFDFEFLDDVYACSGWGKNTVLSTYKAEKPTFTSQGDLQDHAVTYTQDRNTKLDNHVLTVMVLSRRGELLYHPLSLALMRGKWRVAEFFFFSFLFFYVTFVAFLTAYFVFSTPPYILNSTLLDPANAPACKQVLQEAADSNPFILAPSRIPFGSIIIWVLSAIGIATECAQLFHTRLSYFRNYTNLFDWFTYISAIAVVWPIHTCGTRMHWQWQLGATCMFFAWINLIMFLRRLPTIGIYIVMVGEVFVTFARFFVFCFSLFLFAFGFTFFVLFRNQGQFETPMYAFLKMSVMMIGELDYVSMFFPDDTQEDVHYVYLSYIIFLMFLVMVTMVIMNLLTGLAVGDVQEVQEQAELKKMALQVELALDVEYSMPESMRRKLKCTVPSVTLHPNKPRHWLVKKLYRFLDGPMSDVSIARAIYFEYEEALEEQRGKRDEKDGAGAGKISYQQVITQVTKNRERLKDLDGKLDRVESMLRALLQHNKVTWQAQDDVHNTTDKTKAHSRAHKS